MRSMIFPLVLLLAVDPAVASRLRPAGMPSRREAVAGPAETRAGATGVRTLELEVTGPSERGAAWELDGRTASSPGHSLAPEVRLEDVVVLEASLADGSRVTFRAAGAGVRGARRNATLPAGDAELVKELDGSMLRDGFIAVHDSFAGVDELFELRTRGLKHDLVVSRDALRLVPRGDLEFAWRLELPPGARAVLPSKQPGSEVTILDARGGFLGRVPAPLVADASSGHWLSGPAHLELLRQADGLVLSLVVDAGWAFDPAREFPLRLDPGLVIEAAGIAFTGFVDEFGARSQDAIDSGSLMDVGYGSSVRGYAEFDTSSIPDGSDVTNVELYVWLANHDNPLDAAVPLPMQVKRVPDHVSVAPLILHGLIGTGAAYTGELVPRTGPEFCPNSYENRIYDLGGMADDDLEAQLALDFFTVGFVSGIVTDPGFDHIDYMGYSENVANPGCAETALPNSRIALFVTYIEPNNPPLCDAGGPYTSDCPGQPIIINALGSSDPDGDDISTFFTTDCSGTIVEPGLPVTELILDPSCDEDCTLTLEVSDGQVTVSCTTPVSAHDDTPPILGGPGTGDQLACLWPPNHWYVCFSPLDLANMLTASDTCSAVTIRATGCVSDQPDDAPEGGSGWNGDGHTTEDCVVTSDGGICVRSERCGGGPTAQDGRHYGIAVVATDACGNESAPAMVGTIHVPHDQSPHERTGCRNPTKVGCRELPCANRHGGGGPAPGP